MTPELEDALNPIGWQTAIKSSRLWSVMTAGALTSADNRLLSQRDSEARKSAKQVELVFGSVFQTYKLLGELPREIELAVNGSSVPDCEAFRMLASGSTDIPDTVGEIRQRLVNAMIGLEVTLSRLENEAGPMRGGSPKNLRPHAVAYAVAKIYLVGRGEIPTLGKNSSGDGLSGLFGCTVERIFGILGLGYDAYEPCKKAIERIKNLSPEEFWCYVGLRCPVTRPLVEGAIRIRR